MPTRAVFHGAQRIPIRRSRVRLNGPRAHDVRWRATHRVVTASSSPMVRTIRLQSRPRSWASGGAPLSQRLRALRPTTTASNCSPPVVASRSTATSATSTRPLRSDLCLAGGKIKRSRFATRRVVAITSSCCRAEPLTSPRATRRARSRTSRCSPSWMQAKRLLGSTRRPARLCRVTACATRSRALPKNWCRV